MKAEFETPKVERNVVLTMTENEAQILMEIVQGSDVSASADFFHVLQHVIQTIGIKPR